MDVRDDERIKQREIAFRELHPNPDQAGTAVRFLAEVEGVLTSEAASATLLRVSYDVLAITLKEIEDALRELGLHLDNRLLPRHSDWGRYLAHSHQPCQPSPKV